MTQSPPTGELVARLREGTTIRLSETAATYIPPPKLQIEAADAITTLERERDEARALNNKYAWERDKAREERDAAERRSEAFWKPQITASQAQVERLKDALHIAEAVLRNHPTPFSTTDGGAIDLTSAEEAAAIARAALQVEESNG